MRKGTTLLSLGCLFVAATAVAALELTPFPEQYESEGMLYQQAVFKDGESRVTMQLPNRWTCQGSARRLQLTPPATFRFADAVIDLKPLETPQASDEALVQAFEQEVLRSLPPGSQKVEVKARLENPFFVKGHPSYEVVVTYNTLGLTFQRSAVLVNGPEWQMFIRLTAQVADFAALERPFRRAMLSWQWHTPNASAIVAAAP